MGWKLIRRRDFDDDRFPCRDVEADGLRRCRQALGAIRDLAPRAGMQVYRIEAGKLAETWLALQPPDFAWTDAVAQERWTTPPPIK